MTVTFAANVRDAKLTIKAEDCLCAQMCPRWLHGATGAELQAHALPDCPSCKGTGIETIEASDAPSLNWANVNAWTVLEVLGLRADWAGTLTIESARRALLRAQCHKVPPHLIRATHTWHGQSVVRDGQVDVLPLRAIQLGCSADDIRDRVEAFAEFVEACAKRGATLISWG